MRAAPSAYVRFGLISAGLLVAWVFILSRGPGGRMAWIAAAIVVVFCVILMVWLSRFRLEYGDDTVRYRTLFGGDVAADVGMIESAKLATGVRTYRDRFRSRVRLELVGKPGASFRLVPVNGMVFRRDEFKRFSTFLSQRIKP